MGIFLPKTPFSKKGGVLPKNTPFGVFVVSFPFKKASGGKSTKWVFLFNNTPFLKINGAFWKKMPQWGVFEKKGRF